MIQNRRSERFLLASVHRIARHGSHVVLGFRLGMHRRVLQSMPPLYEAIDFMRMRNALRSFEGFRYIIIPARTDTADGS